MPLARIFHSLTCSASESLGMTASVAKKPRSTDVQYASLVFSQLPCTAQGFQTPAQVSHEISGLENFNALRDLFTRPATFFKTSNFHIARPCLKIRPIKAPEANQSAAYTDVSEADENEWQRRVVRFMKVTALRKFNLLPFLLLALIAPGCVYARNSTQQLSQSELGKTQSSKKIADDEQIIIMGTLD